MDRVERIVVQVDESNRLLAAGGPSRWRISLLLLDNTAELLLKFQCDQLLQTNHVLREILTYTDTLIANGETYEESTPFDPPGGAPRRLTERRAELLKQVVDDAELRRIKGQFDDKLTYLLRNGFLNTQYVTVLRRLHRYRNEAYHEDRIRPETLETATKIYTYIVCDLMKSTRPMAVNASASTPDLDAIFPTPFGSRPSPVTFTTQYADDLLARSPIGTPALLASALSVHLISRLDRLDSDLDYVATRGGFTPQAESTRSTTLDEVVALHNSIARSETPGRKEVRATYRSIKNWRRAADKLSTAHDYVRAFDRFAALEVAIEQVEELTDRVVMALDRHIDDEIDRLRMK